jgi:hypothetical protein
MHKTDERRNKPEYSKEWLTINEPEMIDAKGG